jgi:hypothetical protein
VESKFFLKNSADGLLNLLGQMFISTQGWSVSHQGSLAKSEVLTGQQDLDKLLIAKTSVFVHVVVVHEVLHLTFHHFDTVISHELSDACGGDLAQSTSIDSREGLSGHKILVVTKLLSSVLEVLLTKGHLDQEFFKVFIDGNLGSLEWHVLIWLLLPPGVWAYWHDELVVQLLVRSIVVTLDVIHVYHIFQREVMV